MNNGKKEKRVKKRKHLLLPFPLLQKIKRQLVKRPKVRKIDIKAPNYCYLLDKKCFLTLCERVMCPVHHEGTGVKRIRA